MANPFFLPTINIDYVQVRNDIEQNAKPNALFYLMNFLASVVAGYGLLANSPVVVIGAMLIAMMVSPITGIALALIEYRLGLLKQSLIASVTGILMIYAVGMVLGLLHPEQAMTHEIISRTTPTTMDLMVALAGGVAGACAVLSPRLSVTVVGVGIATSLVPPLVASGILLVNGQYSQALGAFLLTFTNILAIQFTNSLVLWLAGFRRESRKPSVLLNPSNRFSQIGLFIRRNLVTLVLLVGVSVYLSINFNRTLKQQQFEKSVKIIVTQTIHDQPSYLVSTVFNANKNAKDQYMIRVLLQGLTAPSYAQVQQMEQQIARLSSQQYPSRKPIKLQVRFIPETVIESTAISKEDVKLDKEAVNQINQTQ